MRQGSRYRGPERGSEVCSIELAPLVICKNFNLGWRLQTPCLQASDRCTSVTCYLQPFADHLASGVKWKTMRTSWGGCLERGKNKNRRYRRAVLCVGEEIMTASL